VSARRFLLTAGALLLAQGTLSLLLDAAGRQSDQLPLRVAEADPLHASIHVVWGLLLLTLVGRGIAELEAARLCLLFGVFYSALALAGVLVHHPLGMRLDRGENVFHLIVGPAALAVGLVQLRPRARTA
jgi:hypothetical protein